MNLLRWRDSGPYARAFSLNSLSFRLECARICPRGFEQSFAMLRAVGDAFLPAGDADSGCSVHIVTADLDAGPLLGQGRVPILPADTEATLATRVLAMEHRLYPQVLRRFLTKDRQPLYLT